MAQPPSATCNAAFASSKKRSAPPPIQSPLSLTIVIDHGPVNVACAYAELLTNARPATMARTVLIVQRTRRRLTRLMGNSLASRVSDSIVVGSATQEANRFNRLDLLRSRHSSSIASGS